MEIDLSEKIKIRRITKWVIGVATACIVIYLTIRHLDVIAAGISWLADITFPILLGIVIALILNVPMRPIEKHLPIKKEKVRRSIAIAFSLALVFGIFIGIAFLVIPEIVEAVRLGAEIIMSGLDQAAFWEQSFDFSGLPFGEELQQIHIDWAQIKDNLANRMLSGRETLLQRAAGALGSVAGGLMNFFIGLIFSIYVLANKEKLKRQTIRLIRVWLSPKFSVGLIHIISVCNRSFRNFVAGQAAEAVILGILCMIGMSILGLPYAPMVSALVGVTALIPIVGAFVGMAVGAFLILTVSPLQTLVFIVFLVILQQLEGNLIYPKVMGARINLPAMWVFAAVAVGGNLAGPAGMLLGVPAAAAAYELLKEATAKRES